MAVDVVLVLQSEHRKLLQLVERCGRPSRGFHDPAAELHIALYAHLTATTAEVYPAAREQATQWPLDVLGEASAVVDAPDPDPRRLVEVTRRVVRAEAAYVVPVLQSRIELTARRRMGKVFRLRRDAAARALAGSHRRHRTQTELYEVARRAGIEQRSRMTQAELQAAIEARGLHV